MATLYEKYNTGDDFSYSLYGINWKAQTFTPSTAHKITSVKLKLFRTASPGTVTVGIRATDASGHPTGADLCSGTINGNTLTATSPGLWYEITLGAGYDLSSGIKYAIVVRVPSGDVSNQLLWRFDGTSPTYAGGNVEKSANSGSTWTSDTGYDFMFEDWGEPLGVTHELTVTDGIGIGEALLKSTSKTLSDGVGIGEALVKSMSRILSDGIGIAEVWSGYKAMLRTFTDGIGIGEALTKTISRVFTDGIGVGEDLWTVWVHGATRVMSYIRNLPAVRNLLRLR